MEGMIMIYQEEMRAAETVALWVGNLDDEDALITYIGQPFEDDFGFYLDQEDLPEYAHCFEGRISVRELFKPFASSEDWMEAAVRKCDSLEIRSAKVAVLFQNLRYHPERIMNAQSPLQFIGNLSWPGGKEAWEMLQKARVIRPPFPKLIRRDFGPEEFGLFHWEGIVRLKSWNGFSFSEDVWRRFKERPQEDYKVNVSPSSTSAEQPTDEQARAFRYLVEHEAAMLQSVLEAVLKVYPQWRESYYGGKWSSDGGKTWQTGWELPDMFPPDDMPEISSIEELKRLISPGTVHIMANPLDGFTRVGFGFSCKWDYEHGLGVLTHKGKVIDVGGADTAFEEYHPESQNPEDV